MAPGPGEAASRPPPVADNYLKGEGGEGEREAEKSKGETGRNEKGRKRGEAVGSGIGEVRGGGRGQKAKRGVL